MGNKKSKYNSGCIDESKITCFGKNFKKFELYSKMKDEDWNQIWKFYYTNFGLCIWTYGPDHLELIIFDILGKKFYNHPSHLQL